MTPEYLRSIENDQLFAGVWSGLDQDERNEITLATGDEFPRRYRVATRLSASGSNRVNGYDSLASRRQFEEIQASPRITALEIEELLKRQFLAKETILSPWLRRQDLTMVHAKRGVGKTHFCVSLAYAVASGTTFLKWEADKPRRVLYIDGEMPGAAIQERLGAIVEASEAEPPEGYFRIITPDAQDIALPDLARLEGQDELQPLLGDAELIVLDNLSTLMRAGIENEGESWVPMATWALAQRRQGRAVLFVHHAGKSGQQRGSSRREDLLDTVICLRHPSDYQPDQGARFEVMFEKSRGSSGRTFKGSRPPLQPGPAASRSGRTRRARELRSSG